MRLVLGMAAAIMAVTLVQPASAQETDGFYTGGRLNERCKTDEAGCRGYIIGAVDAVMAYTSYSKSQPIFCVPQGIDADTIIDVVIKHLEANPAKWQYDAAGQVMLALHNAYPCSTR